MRVKYLPVKYKEKFNLDEYPSFHKSGSVKGMKKIYGDEKYYSLVRCGEWIYKLPPNSEVYWNYAH